MMARKTHDSGARHSASSVQVEERLRARHIDFKLEPNFAIDKIVDAEGHQVRLIQNRAPAEMVTRFAEQMKAGAVFPAIVVNERGELIDGNTRKLAALKSERSTIAAYVCHGLTSLQARSLSVELNQCHGLSMSEEEVHAFVTCAVHEGQTLDTKTCARMTGIRPSTLERWKAQANFQHRAKRCGIRDVDVALLSPSVQAALNGVRLTRVLIAATSLAVAARMPATGVRKLVVKIKAAASESAALEVVATERDSRAAGIRSIANGFTARKRAGHRSGMHIAALLKLGVGELLEVAPEKRTETMSRLRDLRAHLERAISSAAARWELDEAPTPDPSVLVIPEPFGRGRVRG